MKIRSAVLDVKMCFLSEQAEELTTQLNRYFVVGWCSYLCQPLIKVQSKH
jgi:hypothetical protein